MSAGKVSEVKQQLATMGLIKVTKHKRPNGGLPYHRITIVDIWQKNVRHCAPNSQDERASSPDEQASSQGERKKTSLEEEPTQEEGDQESAGADLTPRSFEDWLSAGQATSNKNAVLKRMHDTLFPDRESPAYSYIGTVVKRVGGPGRLAQLLWEAAAKRPTGDVLAYIQATVKGKRGGNGRHDTRTVEERALYIDNGDNPLGVVWMTEEESEEATREFYAENGTDVPGVQGDRMDRPGPKKRRRLVSVRDPSIVCG